MKKEGIFPAIIGGVIAGAAFGTGFVLAQKAIAKKSKKDEVAVVEETVSTRPAVMSNLTGEDLVKSGSWSNASGVELRTDGKKSKCFNTSTGEEVSLFHCQGLKGGSGTGLASLVRRF